MIYKYIYIYAFLVRSLLAAILFLIRDVRLLWRQQQHGNQAWLSPNYLQPSFPLLQ